MNRTQPWRGVMPMQTIKMDVRPRFCSMKSMTYATPPELVFASKQAASRLAKSTTCMMIVNTLPRMSAAHLLRKDEE